MFVFLLEISHSGVSEINLEGNFKTGEEGKKSQDFWEAGALELRLGFFCVWVVDPKEEGPGFLPRVVQACISTLSCALHNRYMIYIFVNLDLDSNT